MMKFKKILNESKMVPAMAKILNILARQGADPEHVSDNYDTIKKKFLINDDELASNMVIIYQKYFNELDEPEDFRKLKEYDIDFSFGDFDNELLAVAKHLETHPSLIGEEYGSYVYLIDKSEYDCYNESDLEDAFNDRAGDHVDELIEVGSIDWLENYITLDDYAVEQFANDDADHRESDMSAIEVIDYMDAEDELETRLEVVEQKQNKLEEFDNEHTDVETKLDELVTELEDVDEDIADKLSEREEAETQDELSDLKNEYDGLVYRKKEIEGQWIYFDHKLDELKEAFDELEREIESMDGDIEEDLGDELRDDLREKLSKEIVEEVESGGLRYFTGNFGYEPKDAIDYFFDINRQEAIDDMESDRGNIMSSYDGDEHEEMIDGKLYTIYRSN